MLTLSGILSACGLRKETPHQVMLREVRRLIELDKRSPRLPDTGRYIPTLASTGGNGTWTLVAGVWINDILYYEALGVPLGSPPPGNDVKDLHPGIPDVIFGRCGCCGRSWKWIKGHDTMYNIHRGFSPLCERCWQKLKTPTARLPYYRTKFDSNTAQLATYEGGKYLGGRETEWAEIEKAVLAGL